MHTPVYLTSPLAQLFSLKPSGKTTRSAFCAAQCGGRGKKKALTTPTTSGCNAQAVKSTFAPAATTKASLQFTRSSACQRITQRRRESPLRSRLRRRPRSKRTPKQRQRKAKLCLISLLLFHPSLLSPCKECVPARKRLQSHPAKNRKPPTPPRARLPCKGLRAAPATNADSRHDPCRTGRLSSRVSQCHRTGFTS